MTDALMDRIKAHRSAPTVYDPPTFEQMADYIQELTLQLLATHGQAADALDKLTKAMEALRFYAPAKKQIGERWVIEGFGGNDGGEHAAAVLAELEVKK